MKFALSTLLILAWFFMNTGCENPKSETYLDEWKEFETQLIRKSKSFQQYEKLDSIRGDFKLVTYVSDSMKLQGLLNTKNIEADSKKPALVFLHGGFALGYGQMKMTKPFTDAGFVVFAPTFRGQNGNPGFVEFFMGEVHDARAAIRWISEQNYIDAEEIYVFGWSVGGGIALNLSLHDDIPVRLSASSAGIYDRSLMHAWATEDDMIIFPYDHLDETENYYRLSIYNLQNMVRPHFTYVAKQDYYDYQYVRNLVDSLYPRGQIDLQVVEVVGDHVSSVEVAAKNFLEEIQRLRQ